MPALPLLHLASGVSLLQSHVGGGCGSSVVAHSRPSDSKASAILVSTQIQLTSLIVLPIFFFFLIQLSEKKTISLHNPREVMKCTISEFSL